MNKHEKYILSFRIIPVLPSISLYQENIGLNITRNDGISHDNSNSLHSNHNSRQDLNNTRNNEETVCNLNVPEHNQDIDQESLNHCLRIGGTTIDNSTNLPSNSCPGLIINNVRFNENLISIYGISLLMGMLVLILIPAWMAHSTKDPETLYVLFFVLLTAFPVGLPTIYFILNPKHFLIAVDILPCTS